jgi:hypothetical protein
MRKERWYRFDKEGDDQQHTTFDETPKAAILHSNADCMRFFSQ